MTRCQSCGTEHLDSARYCDECGSELDRRVPPQEPAAPRVPQVRSNDADVKPVQPPAKTLARVVVESRPPESAKLVVMGSGRLGQEFPLTVSPCLIGRWDPEHQIFPEVDLEGDDPEANVSRRHAVIHYQDGQYLIEDVGSTNGTFINRGHRLITGRRYLLQDGDEVIVGKTFLKFVIG